MPIDFFSCMQYSESAMNTKYEIQILMSQIIFLNSGVRNAPYFSFYIIESLSLSLILPAFRVGYKTL
jgi:hypothetical protein